MKYFESWKKLNPNAQFGLVAAAVLTVGWGVGAAHYETQALENKELSVGQIVETNFRHPNLDDNASAANTLGGLSIAGGIALGGMTRMIRRSSGDFQRR